MTILIIDEHDDVVRMIIGKMLESGVRVISIEEVRERLEKQEENNNK